MRRRAICYWFQVDDESKRYPDPASRFQPHGVHGPSQVVDWRAYDWQDADVAGRRDFAARCSTSCTSARSRPRARGPRRSIASPHLRDVGVTLIEVMPVAEFQGEFGWGYDGVYWFAPTRLYGRPDDFRAFVDHAHQLGVGVILDVVYNHFGPTGNYLAAFSPYYVSQEARDRMGRGDQLRRRIERARCASSSPRTPPTGFASITSTACGSTPRRRSSTTRTSTFSTALTRGARRRPANGRS